MVRTDEFALVRFDGDQEQADAVYAGVAEPAGRRGRRRRRRLGRDPPGARQHRRAGRPAARPGRAAQGAPGGLRVSTPGAGRPDRDRPDRDRGERTGACPSPVLRRRQPRRDPPLQQGARRVDRARGGTRHPRRLPRRDPQSSTAHAWPRPEPAQPAPGAPPRGRDLRRRAGAGPTSWGRATSARTSSPPISTCTRARPGPPRPRRTRGPADRAPQSLRPDRTLPAGAAAGGAVPRGRDANRRAGTADRLVVSSTTVLRRAGVMAVVEPAARSCRAGRSGSPFPSSTPPSPRCEGDPGPCDPV